MGRVERAVAIEAVKVAQSGAAFVSEEQLQASAIAAGGTGAAAKYAVERLVRRGVLGSQWKGCVRIGYLPTAKAYSELGQEPTA